jgi:hypothetical protein
MCDQVRPAAPARLAGMISHTYSLYPGQRQVTEDLDHPLTDLGEAKGLAAEHFYLALLPFIVGADWLVRTHRTGARRDGGAPARARGALLAAGALMCLVGCGHSHRTAALAPVRPASGVSSAATKLAVAASLRLVIRASPTPWKLPAAVYRTVAVASGERIFVLGGHNLAGETISDVYELDTRTGETRTAGTLVLPTHGAAAAVLGGRILVFGGASTSVHDVVQEFDPARGSARLVGHLPGVRADVTAAVAGNRVVLAGGFDGVGPQGDVWATADGRMFRVIGRLRQAVRYPAVVAQGSDVYVFGGLISGGEYTGTFSTLVERVHLPSGATQVVGRLPTPLAHAMGALVGGRILVLGGSTPAGPSAAILRFDPASGRTVRAGHLPRPLTDAAVAAVGDSAYLLGGITTQPQRGVTVVRLSQAK